MKARLAILAAFCLFGGMAVAETPSAELVAAIGQHESRNNDNAIGDRNLSQMAYGYLQIRQCCVYDVNRRYGTHYRAEDCLGNRSLSILICQRYIAMYATQKRLGREPTNEDMARIWNGGPDGWRRSSTLDYWVQVRTHLPPSR